MLQYLPITNPTLIFFVVLIIILFAPIVMGRLRIPHIIGMVLAGIAVGKYGFNVLERDSSFELFGRVGLLYIMFLAGLEMDMEGLRKDLRKISVFGLLTFLIPFILTFCTGIYILDYSPLASTLLACIMSSNTLIAYPIVVRYGLQRHTVSTISVGASMLSLLLALIAVAALVGSFQGGTGPEFWGLFALKFLAFCIICPIIIRKLTRWFLRKYSDAVMQFIFALSLMFFCTATSELIGLEGIFGAFYCGLILNRFIPSVSPLMNRLEFIGNALFIPYFLIGVGMLINIRTLFEDSNVLTVVACMVIIGTLGKAIAAYLSAAIFRRPRYYAHMMFGLTSAHAAGGIAMVMIGMGLEVSPGVPLAGNDMLNGVVMMILFTCIISTIITENASKNIIYKEKQAELASSPERINHRNILDDEKILIPVKYPDTCDMLVNLGIMMRNPKLGRGLIALNVVYDDENAQANQREGRRILEQVQQTASAADVRVMTQVRLATNIANGIKHAFKEYDASEIILGMHNHDNSSRRFWGEFAQSLFNGLNRQITIVRCLQPLNTLRSMHVAIPPRAELEPGFSRWLERLARLAGSLGLRIVFHGRDESLTLVRNYVTNVHPGIRAEYTVMANWGMLRTLASVMDADQMLVVINARRGTISYESSMERLPDELTANYKDGNLMIIFPDQYGDQMDEMTFATPQHKEQSSAWEWIYNHLGTTLRNKLSSF